LKVFNFHDVGLGGIYGYNSKISIKRELKESNESHLPIQSKRNNSKISIKRELKVALFLIITLTTSVTLTSVSLRCFEVRIRDIYRV